MPHLGLGGDKRVYQLEFGLPTTGIIRQVGVFLTQTRPSRPYPLRCFGNQLLSGFRIEQRVPVLRTMFRYGGCNSPGQVMLAYRTNSDRQIPMGFSVFLRGRGFFPQIWGIKKGNLEHATT